MLEVPQAQGLAPSDCSHSFVCDFSERKLAEGTTYRAVVRKVDGLSMTIESPSFDATDKDARRAALDWLFCTLGYVLRRDSFPEHTQIADAEVGADGRIIYTNLRYPEEGMSYANTIVSEPMPEAAETVQNTQTPAVVQKRLVRRLDRRDKRIAGLERKIQQLENALAWRTMDLESLSRNVRREVQDALCNVRMIPVFGGTRDKVITEVRNIPANDQTESATSVRTRKDRPWSEYPVGTKAPAIMGGRWYRTERGWKWNGPDGSGGTFPTPGGDSDGTVILPQNDQGEAQPPAKNL